MGWVSLGVRNPGSRGGEKWAGEMSCIPSFRIGFQEEKGKRSERRLQKPRIHFSLPLHTKYGFTLV